MKYAGEHAWRPVADYGVAIKLGIVAGLAAALFIAVIYAVSGLC